MIDFAGFTIERLLDNDTIVDYIDDRAFAYRIPEGSVPPLIRISASTMPLTSPDTPWRIGLVTIDIHHENSLSALAMAGIVETEVVPTFFAGSDAVVVTEARIDSVQPQEDGGWTPIRFRQIVTVEVTAREP